MTIEDIPRSGTIVVRDEQIVMASEGAARLLGYDLARLQQMPFAALFAPEDRERIIDRYRRRIAGEPVPTDYEASVLLADGSRATFELHVDREGRDVVVHYRDISQEMTRRARLHALATLGVDLQRAQTTNELLERLRTELPKLEIFPMLMRAMPAGVRVEWSELPGAVEAGFQQLFGRPLAGFTGRWSAFSRKVWDEGVAFTDDWGAEAASFVPELHAAQAREIAAAQGLPRAVAVRLDERGGPRFYLILPCTWLRGDDLAAARLFAAQVAAALDGADAIADLSRRLSDVTALHALTGRIFANPPGDVAALLQDGCREIAAALSCAGAAIDLVEADGALRLAARAGAPIDRETAVAVQLVGRGAVLGMVRLTTVAGRPFTDREWALAQALAGELAVGLENARLYRETAQRAEELGLLHEVGRSLVATLDIEQVLDAGVRNLARIVEASMAVLALVTEDGAALEYRAVFGGPREIVGRRPPLDVEGSLGALAFMKREAIVVEDALSDPRIRQEQRAIFGARAYLVVPLLVRERFVGTAVIMDTRGPRRFGPAEVERATAVANQLAVAVENARLYADLRRSYQQLAQAQRQLIQKERLAALGELSAVVAHEVRNPLGVIFNSLGSLRRMLQPTGDAKMLLDIVGEEADRLNRIVRDLLDFARPVTPVVRPEPLEAVVDEAVAAALAEGGGGVVVDREAELDLPPVPMDARLVRQAVLNLAENAVQAMPKGGWLRVRVRRDGGAVVLELADTGAGIPEEIRARIFEPFFTTKATGTGLGLAVVKRIVEGHGGEIAVSHGAEGGTVFQLRFPIAARAGGPVESAGRIG